MTVQDARDALIKALTEWTNAGGPVEAVADAILVAAVICAGGEVKL